MPKYFFRISNTYSSKNKLTAAVSEVLAKHYHTLLGSPLDKDRFLKRLSDEVKGLSTEHPRCAPLSLSVNSFGDRGLVYVSVHGVCEAHLYTVKKDLSQDNL